MWLNCRTEFTFKAVYGHLDAVASKLASMGSYGGMTDINNTFGHIRWKSACDKAGIKPIYGVQLAVTDGLGNKIRRYPFNMMTFIAKTQHGLQLIYKLVDQAHQQFYYKPLISYDQVNELPGDHVAILSGVACRFDLITRPIWFELSPSTPYSQRDKWKELDRDMVQPIACLDNYYPDPEDKAVYEPFAESRLREQKTSAQHILTWQEWLAEFPGREFALDNLVELAGWCNVELAEAPMTTYVGKDDIEVWAREGATKKGINITTGDYADRYNREMKLIKDKGYVDYFLIVADAIRYAKTKMSVGPSRGSSAGSLVCYLMGITEIDPLEYDLYFERFIDINRFDLPDIDIDFQDEKRHLVLKYLQKKYGKDCVAQIGNISRMKAKSAIDRFAKALRVPIDDVQEVKDAIMERSGGDARANYCIEDSLSESEVGKKFLDLYPHMAVVSKIEAHASHTGVHAAGILVCNEPITNYCGINSRDKKRIGMLDKKDAEAVGLLKIDALGLRTLSILADVCDQLGKPYTWLYEIPVDDPATYKVFNDQRFNGIFQFEGSAVKGLARQMPIEDMEDISALSALGRPGPLASGGANRFIKYRTGKEEPNYLSNHPAVVKATKGTYGVVIYQEQMLAISREYGQLSWEDTNQLRRAASKSLGDEFFGKYKEKFVEGAKELGESDEAIDKVWDGINTMGSWAFNKSHSVSYGLVSYLCAYMKANHFMEFAVASLNHSRDDSTALKILRDMVENDGVEYVHIDEHLSEIEWSIYDGKLYGGLLTLPGIGLAKARKIIKTREANEAYTPAIRRILNEGKTPFKYLYPAKEIYGDFYTDPARHNVSGQIVEIKDAEGDGDWCIIGKLIKKNLRDANEACFVSKRDGQYETGNTAWLNITLEDDTDSVMCKIKRDDYERLGREIAETGKEDKDWYMVYGSKINGWGLIFVTNIMRITRDE